MEDVLQVVPEARAAVRRCCPSTELRGPGPGAADLPVEASVARADEPVLGGGGAGPTRRAGERREPAHRAAGLRPPVRRRALRQPPVEGHRRGPDPDREPPGGRLRGAHPHGEGAAGGRAGLHPDGSAPAGQGPGPGRGHRDREDRVLAQSPHAVLEAAPVPPQEDHRAAADGAADQRHRAGGPALLRKRRRKSGLLHTDWLFVNLL